MRQGWLIYWGLVLGLLLIPMRERLGTSQANTIFLRHFESADVFLTDQSLQVFSLSALAEEELTIVVYGLEPGLEPALSLFNAEGQTIAEDINQPGEAVAVLSFRAEQNGVYSFVVSRRNEQGGLVRVMLFEGQPLGTDYSLLDTVDPLLPSRAYLVAGDSQRPVVMTIQVQETAEEGAEPPQVFASRGTQLAPPPLEERLTAVEQFTWENTNGNIFYTLNVRAIPEPVGVSHKLGGQFRQLGQFLETADIRLDIGLGQDEADRVLRPICQGKTIAPSERSLGPGQDFADVGSLPADQAVEVLGFQADYFLILDTQSNTGATWVPADDLQMVSDVEGPDCGRVAEIPAPDPEAVESFDPANLPSPSSPEGNSGQTEGSSNNAGGNENANPPNPAANPNPPAPNSGEDNQQDNNNDDHNDDNNDNADDNDDNNDDDNDD
jgi:hypothetical protein